MTSIHSSYIGRFAPSPSGPLHFGSLIAAMGSYLQARKNQGKWLVRIEDIDPPREMPGASDDILKSLEAFGFEWDESVQYQSQHLLRYQACLDSLQTANKLYACDCTRKKIASYAHPLAPYAYSGYCRERKLTVKNGCALRIKIHHNCTYQFDDLLQGLQQQDLNQQAGDFVLRRRDGLYAYQLAVVLDDAESGVSEVVRGIDLLDCTARQLFLQETLGFSRPNYLHLPLALNDKGDKLSKQTFAPALNTQTILPLLNDAWKFLGQRPLAHNADISNPQDFWQQAIENWSYRRILVKK